LYAPCLKLYVAFSVQNSFQGTKQRVLGAVTRHSVIIVTTAYSRFKVNVRPPRMLAEVCGMISVSILAVLLSLTVRLKVSRWWAQRPHLRSRRRKSFLSSPCSYKICQASSRFQGPTPRKRLRSLPEGDLLTMSPTRVGPTCCVNVFLFLMSCIQQRRPQAVSAKTKSDIWISPTNQAQRLSIRFYSLGKYSNLNKLRFSYFIAL